jgi:hypothetical protein
MAVDRLRAEGIVFFFALHPPGDLLGRPNYNYNDVLKRSNVRRDVFTSSPLRFAHQRSFLRIAELAIKPDPANS